MHKPDSLRAAIATAVPELAQNPDRLKIWLEKGRIRAPMTDSRAFAYEYALNVVVTDYTGHPSIIFLAINDWLRVNQPDLLRPDASGGYSFDADIMDNQTVDLGIELQLSEQVKLTSREGGGWNLEHLAEPDPLFPDDAPLVDPSALLREIWWKGEQLVP